LQAVRSVASGGKFYRLLRDKENTAVVQSVSCTKKKTFQKKKEITPKKTIGSDLPYSIRIHSADKRNI